MSFSVLRELEACPRRWALASADYPEIWAGRGYPTTVNLRLLIGSTVHRALDIIATALSERSCTAITDIEAVNTLKDMGGFSKALGDSISHVLKPFDDNPRTQLILDTRRRELLSSSPSMRRKVQRLLCRLRLERRPPRRPSEKPIQSNHALPVELTLGSHTEKRLRAPDLGWHGVADLITISSQQCEIRDFKTGQPGEAHKFQLRAYALLWWLDTDLNPSKRVADSLVLSYDSGDVPVDVPGPDDLQAIERDLRTRTAEAVAALKGNPPEARPSPENCNYCGVRQLCDAFWERPPSVHEDPTGANYTDVQLRLSACHSEHSWDGVVESESCSVLESGQSILLRTTELPFPLRAEQRLRLLNVRVSAPAEDLDNEPAEPTVATMTRSSEAFLLPSLA